MKRRKFLKNTIYGIAGTSLLTGLYAWQIEPFWLEFVRRKMPIKNLPKKMIGKTLMQISDVHVGNRFDYSYIIDSFKKAQKLNPDFVVYTGDYVSYEDETQFKQLDEVLRHVVKGKSGTVGILGNHDYGKDWAEQKVANKITAQLESAGVKMLSNTQIEIEGLNIIGFDDYWALNFAPEKVMNNYDPEKANIVLCHNPDVCDLDVWQDYQGWILSGHTHGGQCKPPFLDPPILPVKNKRYNSGIIDLYDGRTLYINRALGHLWQVRFNVRPEITIFELHRV
ncbi:metallophosphoesterase [Mesohalobacter halotolerans]|uniref:Phosphoesterase n=1 Tax=Mesohalobacter halotolerans TaxID=1883405 RepID=A0A4U5TQX2_9FLAO|nr:metallophosphoesterase [Mesohalobacter halotolerans]MBS3738779.1 metallophosphoesterase [Psychroflexus sp.]TKS55764.1 phosphoesterase [Mesohalobacter halotolerans]